jgi:hypothetical protein
MTDKLTIPGHTWTQDVTGYDGQAYDTYTHGHRKLRGMTDKLMTPGYTWTQDATRYDRQGHDTWTHMDTCRHRV